MFGKMLIGKHLELPGIPTMMYVLNVSVSQEVLSFLPTKQGLVYGISRTYDVLWLHHQLF